MFKCWVLRGVQLTLHIFYSFIHILHHHISQLCRGNVWWETCLGLLWLVTAWSQTPDSITKVTGSAAFINYSFRPQFINILQWVYYNMACCLTFIQLHLKLYIFLQGMLSVQDSWAITEKSKMLPITTVLIKLKGPPISPWLWIRKILYSNLKCIVRNQTQKQNYC